MKKSFTAILFCLCMFLSLMPATVYAADVQEGTSALTVNQSSEPVTMDLNVQEKYDLYILLGNAYTGTRVTSDNAEDVLNDGGSVSYDPGTCTLTLNNAKIAGIYTYGNESKTLTINVIGDCTIEAQRLNAINLYASSTAGPVYHRDSLVITGDGTLVINALGNNTVGIAAYDDVTILGSNVEINSASTMAIAVQTQNDPNQGDIDLNIIDSTVTATTNGTGTNAFWTANGGIKINNSDVTVSAELSSYPLLWAATSIEVTGGSDVMATGGTSNTFYTAGEIKIDGSTVTANGASSPNPAMYATSIEITGGSDVTATGGDGNAIYADYGGIIIDNSTVKAATVGEYASFAIYTYEGDLFVRNGSNVTAESAGDTALYIEGNMSVTDSAVTATGTNYQGIIVCGALNAKDSTLTVLRTTSSDNSAMTVEQLNVDASEITADGGIEFYNYLTYDTDNIAFSVTPADGKLIELKVDDENHDGSAALHFKECAESPYDATVNFDTDAMNALSSYKYVHIEEHIHAGGTATCTTPAICDDCGREYGDVNPDNHSFTNYVYNDDATCTANGTETAKCDRCSATDTREKAGTLLGHDAVKTEAKAATCTEGGNIEFWYCDRCGKYFSDDAFTKEILKEDTIIPANGHGQTEVKGEKEATCTAEGYTGDKVCKDCGEVLETGKTIPKLAHNYKDGKCTVCGASDPNYKPTSKTAGPTDGADKGQTSPKTGDNSNLTIWLTLLLTSGAAAAAIAAYDHRRKKSNKRM